MKISNKARNFSHTLLINWKVHSQVSINQYKAHIIV